MKVQYELHYNGAIQRKMSAYVENPEDLSVLRAVFWATISLPWNGATVVLRRI